MKRPGCWSLAWMLAWSLGLGGWLAGLGPVFAAQEDDRIVPVLCYHRLAAGPDTDLYSLSGDAFRRHLEIIREEGLTPITVSDWVKALDGEKPLPEAPVLITFDDGYRDFLRRARPHLQAMGYPATLFIYTQFVGSRLALTRAELATLQAEGFEIASHSATHPKLIRRPPGETPEQRQQRLADELAQSRQQLQQWSGGPVLGLAYPYGLWDNEVAAAAQAAGYRLLFTVDPGVNRSHAPQTALKRFMILRSTSDRTLRAWLREQPLTVTAWEPAVGERVPGPLRSMRLTLAPEMREAVAVDSLKAQFGSAPVPLQYDALTGEVQLHWVKPWRRGVNLLFITARDQERKRVYRESRTVIVE